MRALRLLPLALLAAATLGVSATPPAVAQSSQTEMIGPEGDGPYVARDGKGWRARSIGADGKPLERSIRPGGSMTVGTVEDVPAFAVRLRAAPAAPAPAMLPLDPATRLLVVADTHGEYPILVAFLQRQGVLDAKLGWAFGKGQLVVTGDMFDRGAHQTEILWLLYKLEAEARRAGGAVHVLLGNHEAMVLRGDLRYLHPRYPAAAKALGAASYSELFAPGTVLGDWLRSRPAVLKLGDLLLLHGGISPAILDAGLGVDALNAGIRASLAAPIAQSKTLGARTALIAGSEGPQWYRGYFGEGSEPTSATDVDRTLKTYGVSRVLIGHTVVDEVTPLYGGKIIAVQVYPHRDKANGAPILEGALRESGHWFRVTANGLKVSLETTGV